MLFGVVMVMATIRACIGYNRSGLRFQKNMVAWGLKVSKLSTFQ